jgi:hypothetical protein
MEDRFFRALLEGDGAALRAVLASDFLLIDVMTGSEVPAAALIELVGGGQLVFESVERLGSRTRVYGPTAIVTGETRMRGHFGPQAFDAHSRYTHAYWVSPQGWRLVTAQGTPIAS